MKSIILTFAFLVIMILSGCVSAPQNLGFEGMPKHYRQLQASELQRSFAGNVFTFQSVDNFTTEVSFNSDKTFAAKDLKGDNAESPGTWSVNNGQLCMTFTKDDARFRGGRLRCMDTYQHQHEKNRYFLYLYRELVETVERR